MFFLLFGISIYQGFGMGDPVFFFSFFRESRFHVTSGVFWVWENWGVLSFGF